MVRLRMREAVSDLALPKSSRPEPWRHLNKGVQSLSSKADDHQQCCDQTGRRSPTLGAWDLRMAWRQVQILEIAQRIGFRLELPHGIHPGAGDGFIRDEILNEQGGAATLSTHPPTDHENSSSFILHS
jgi:hypothetical protein